MPALSEEQLLLSLLAMAVILVVGRGAAEVARRVGQPEVLGELLGGFLLGPSVFGALAHFAYHGLFGEAVVGRGLSLLSWIGAVLLLLLAGIEVDLDILRSEAKAGALTAGFAIVSSLVAGTLFAWRVLGRAPSAATFLGVVLSVTAVSVASKILIERGALRRAYAQVILAAGIASEVLVWLLVAVVSAIRGGSPVVAGVRTAVFAVLFFAFMMTLGRRFTFWAMRRVADLSQIGSAQLSLVLVLCFLSAAITQRLGMHALLGAFVFGVLLSRSPRATGPLRERLQGLTVAFFGPIFFVLAGMRVDIFRLGHLSAIGMVLLLFAVATLVKVGFGMLGGVLGGLGVWRAALVGAGVNLKGGTDVIVAILGAELGLLSARSYAMYTIVAILTVIVSPPVLSWLERRVPASPAEAERLEREEARRRAYLPTIERVLVPMVPQLLPAAAASVVETIATAKGEEDEFFDIAQITIKGEVGEADGAHPHVQQAAEDLRAAGTLQRVELTQRRVEPAEVLAEILAAASGHTLIAIGATRPAPAPTLSLGPLQDRLIDRAENDVLVAIGDTKRSLAAVRRILMPVNGLEYTLKAADVAAYLAKALDAELVLLTIVRRGQQGRQALLREGSALLGEARFRTGRLDIRVSRRVEVGEDVASVILAELRRDGYDLLVLGAVDRSGDDRLYLGESVRRVLTATDLPTVLLVSHERPAGQAAAA